MNPEVEKTTGATRDLFLALAAACAFRIFFWQAMGRALDSADAIHYLAVAKHLAQGDIHAIDPRIPPLYPFLCALVMKIIVDPERAARLVSLAASTLTVIPVYLLSRRLHGRAGARVAVLGVLFWPWLADYGSRVGPEALALLLWLSAVTLLLYALGRGGFSILLAAVAFFALHLTRPEGTLLMLAAPLGGLIFGLGRDKKVLLRLLPLIAAIAVLMGIYMLFMHWLTGQASANTRVANVAGTLGYLNARSVELFKTFNKVLTEVIPVMVGPLFLLFAGVGLFQRSQQPRLFRQEAVVGFFALVQCGLAVGSTYPEPRYIMAPVVVATLWSARGMVLVAQQARNAGHGRWVSALPVAAMLALMALGTATVLVPPCLGRIPRDPVEYKTAGIWMKENLTPGLILTRKPQVGYYADMPTSGPAPNDTPETLLQRAAEIGARYCVIDERYTASMIPALKPLLDPRNAPPGLKLCRDDLSPYPGARVVVYEVVGALPSPTPAPAPATP